MGAPARHNVAETVGREGFEPPTRRLRVCRSNQAELTAPVEKYRKTGVTEGTRTPNPQDHNLVL